MGNDLGVEQCEFEDVFELASQSVEDNITPKDRPRGQWFRIEGVGMVCLWEPQNRSSTKRISHWWVAEEYRGAGYGEALLDAAIGNARESDCETLDILVYNVKPIEGKGFEKREHGSTSSTEYYQRSV